MNDKEKAAAVKRLLQGTTKQAPRCDTAIFDRGEMVLKLHGPRGYLIERFVVAAREEAKVPIDWHFAGGVAIVLALSEDVDKATSALVRWMPAFKEAAKHEVGRDGGYEVSVAGWGDRRPPKPNELPSNAIGFDVLTNSIFLSDE